MSRNENITYQAIEDNGGGLHLAVFYSGKLIYLGTGFEFQKSGSLLECIDGINEGDDADDIMAWEKNEEDEQAVYDDITSHDYGWNVVADEAGIYSTDMGHAATEEFFRPIEEYLKEEETTLGDITACRDDSGKHDPEFSETYGGFLVSRRLLLELDDLRAWEMITDDHGIRGVLIDNNGGRSVHIGKTIGQVAARAARAAARDAGAAARDAGDAAWAAAGDARAAAWAAAGDA